MDERLAKEFDPDHPERVALRARAEKLFEGARFRAERDRIRTAHRLVDRLLVHNLDSVRAQLDAVETRLREISGAASEGSP